MKNPEVTIIMEDGGVIRAELYPDIAPNTVKKNGMFIGLHGYKHYWLGCLNAKQMEDDILQALEVMEEFVNLNSWVMNYPYGSHNKSIIKFIQENGCKLGMTTEVQVADLTIKNRFQIPRLDTNDFPPISNQYMKV